MKKLNQLFIGILFISIISCSKEQQKPFDESRYFDQDANCTPVNNPATYSGVNCCDVDGRIIVQPNESYNYTYKGTYSNSPNLKINWEVISGSITIINGQNTSEATFKFGADFTTGKISATGKLDSNCCDCQNILEITKL